MRNIKYITNVRIPTPRAQGYAIMKMCEEFSRQGNNVELIVPNRRNNESEKNPFKYYGIEENFRIRKIASIDLLGPFEAFGKLFYWIDILSFLLSLGIRRMWDKGDIIYTRDYLIFSVISPEYSCLEVHDIPKRKFLFKKLIKKPSHIFVLNKYIKDEIVSMGVGESKIYISPSGVDIKDFDIPYTIEQARREVGLPEDKKIVMYTGHLYEWKGVYTLAEAARMLPQYLFVFLGGAEPELAQFKESYKNVQNIVALPFIERSRIPIYLKSADVLVVPNSKGSDISEKYTSPLKLLEYMASKRPIVVSDLPSLKEVLKDECCEFAEADNPKSFAEAINKLIYDTDYSQKCVDNAYQRVGQFSWKKKAQDIIAVINR